MTSPHPVRTHPDVEAWMTAFARAVRGRDLAAGRTLVADDAAGFGTVAGRYDDADALEREQWSGVWPRTEGYAWDLDGAVCWPSDDLVVVIATWSSTGVDDDEPRPREGRATVALARTEEGLRAVHTHFSMLPGTAA